MIPWKHLDTATVPGSSSQLHLYQRDQEFSIRVDRAELMNSRVYTSEDGFSQLGCERVKDRRGLRVLIGGLGMGYSLRSALNQLRKDARVVVAELVPQVAAWNRELFGHLAGHPLRDRRVTLEVKDVGQLMRESKAGFDLIMLDVDNGPEGLTRKSNDWIYGHEGLVAAREALSPRGVVGYWSSSADRGFVKRLRQVGFDVEELSLRSGVGGRGAKHTIWFGVVRSVGRERQRVAVQARRGSQ
jgi:spermidine synthase